MTSTEPTAPASDPGFFRGEDEAQPCCDFLLPSGDACDAPPSYEIWWKPVPSMDGNTLPVSAACLEHALPVDRRLVETMRTHQLARSVARDVG